MRILYVEDNPANLFLVQRVARMGNHEVLNYTNGESALENFERDTPDLVLMDVQLAGAMSGLDVVRRLRSSGYKTPIIAVTAYAMVGDRERCLEAGCDDYLSKPLPVPKLVELITRYDPKTREVTLPVMTTAEATVPAGSTTAAPAPAPAADKPASGDSAVPAAPTTAPAVSPAVLTGNTDATLPTKSTVPIPPPRPVEPNKPAVSETAVPSPIPAPQAAPAPAPAAEPTPSVPTTAATPPTDAPSAATQPAPAETPAPKADSTNEPVTTSEEKSDKPAGG